MSSDKKLFQRYTKKQNTSVYSTAEAFANSLRQLAGNSHTSHVSFALDFGPATHPSSGPISFINSLWHNGVKAA